MKVLFLAHLFPLPLDSGGKIKSYYTLKALAAAHDVCILAYTRTDEEKRLVPELGAISPQLRTVPLSRGRGRQVTDALSALLSGTSCIVSRDYRREMQRAFSELIATFQPEIVHIDHLQMAQFVDFNGPYRVVLDHHNVESTIIKRMAETSQSLPMRVYAGLEWPKLRRYEIDICRRCDLVVTVSESDRDALVRLGANEDKLESVPIGVDTEFFRPVERDKASHNILSIGTMYWPPNIDSMLYFAGNIMPLIRKQLPDCTLTIAGARPSPAVKALAADPGISVTGYIDDVRDVARNCGVFVVPLRSGSGVRVKLLNAFAMGLPVVSTSVGAEGLEVRDGRELLIADTPADFADAVIRVLTDADLAQKLGLNAQALVQAKYSWDSIGRRLLGVYQQRFAD